MKVTVDSRATTDVTADMLAIALTKRGRGKRLPPQVAALDRARRGALTAALSSGDFSGKKGESVLLYPSGRLRAKRLLLLGLGEEKKLDAEALRGLAGRAVGEAVKRKAGRVAIAIPTTAEDALEARLQALAEGSVLSGYRFDAYRSAKAKNGGRVTTVSLLLERGGNLRAARAAAKRGTVLAESQNLAR